MINITYTIYKVCLSFHIYYTYLYYIQTYCMSVDGIYNYVKNHIANYPDFSVNTI